MIVGSTIRLQVDELSRREWERLLSDLTFHDVEDNEIQVYQWNGNGAVTIPRGARSLLPRQLPMVDKRSFPAAPKLHYARQLGAPGYEGQIEAVAAMVEHGEGQVIAPPGRGKTEIAAAFIAGCKTRVLVIVHTRDLLNQWVDRLETAIPGVQVGVIAGQTFDTGKQITVAMAQTLRKHIKAGKKFWSQWGCLIIDEAHHAAAETWEWILNVCTARLRFGITASKKRSDGRQRLVSLLIGPIIFEIEFESQVPIVVTPVCTPFRTNYSARQWTGIVKMLVKDDKRNEIIAEIVAKEIKEGRTILVLSRQIKHLELIHECIELALGFDEGWLQQVKLVSGKVKTRKQDIASLTDGSIRCILGTQLFEEGVDIPRLDCIVLAFPGTDITVLQKVGRGSRLFEGKTETLVYDIVDPLVPKLAEQYTKRKAWYEKSEFNNIKVRKAVRHDQAQEGKRRPIRDRLVRFSIRRPSGT